jgi:hypothetical protein
MKSRSDSGKRKKASMMSAAISITMKIGGWRYQKTSKLPLWCRP